MPHAASHGGRDKSGIRNAHEPKITARRSFYLQELNAIKEKLADTSGLEKEKRKMDEQLSADAKAVNDLITRNASMGNESGRV